MTVPSYPPPQAGTPGRDVTAVMGRRTLAWLIDLLIYIGVSVAVFAAVAEYVEVPTNLGGFDACELLELQDADAAAGCIEIGDRAYLTSSADNLVQLLASLCYFAVFVLLQGAGASPGKFLTGLRVVDEQGQRAGVGKSFIRTVLWVVDGAPWFAPIVGFVVGLTSTGHRRVGDMAARTYVISKADVGSPVVVGGAPPPPTQSAWGAPPPTGPASWPPPTTPPTSPPGSVPPPASSPTAPPSEEVDALVPDISGVPDDKPAPPPVLADEPPSWEPPSLTPPDQPDPATAAEPPPDTAPPAWEAHEAADIGTPEVPADPEWWSGPEASPGTAPGSGTPSEPEPAGSEWAQQAEPEATQPAAVDWEPPTTPNADMAPTDDPSPTAGPSPFVAPGADPVADAPQGPAPMELPPPQWDAARNTYIQWDPRVQHWLWWDNVAQQWRRIEG